MAGWRVTGSDEPLTLLWMHPSQQELVSTLGGRFVPHRFEHACGAAGVLPEVAAAVEVVVTNAAVGVPSAAMAALPRLRLIVSLGIGVDAIDLDCVRERGIALVNTPKGDGQAVADHALALLLATSRRVCLADRFVRAGEWGRGPVPVSTGLAGRTCGVVGVGEIGAAIARRVEAFGVKVAYMARSPKPHLPWPYYAEIEALAAAVDVLILALPGDRQSPPMVTERVLAALGGRGILINVARGCLVDTVALARALTTGVIEAAALDVFYDEPSVPTALRELDNVVLTPHIAGFTRSNIRALNDSARAKLDAFATGRPLTDRVA